MFLNKNSLVIIIFAFFVCFGNANNVNAGLECPTGFDDCDCDASTGNNGCEKDVSSDPFNCGKCGNVCASKNCVNGSCSPVTGGLVPCGRLFDNPDTTWSEQENCKICHAVPLMNSVTDYLVGIVGLITILFIIIGGFISVTTMGGSGALNLAKTAISKSLLGFVFVLVAWAIVNVGMVVFGFEDPLGDGSWNKFDCNLMSGPITNYYCGDGIVTNPNDNGIEEVCDPKETKNDFIARTGLTGEDWVEEIYACDPTTCDLGCTGDPLVGEIGEGCYLDLNDNEVEDADECQKGRYICDFSLNSPAVVCKNTYNDSAYRLAGHYCMDIYDYCCRYIDSSSYNFSDAQNDLGNLSWSRQKPSAATSGSGSFKCDDICKNDGKVCIGVGLTDNVANVCVAVRCHSGNNCTASANNVKEDCRTTYPFLTDSDSCTNPETYHVGYTSCICY